MDKRFLVVGAGLLAAIAVLTLAILAGGPGQSTSTGPAPTPPTLVNPGISAEDLTNPRPPSLTDVGVVRDFQLYSEDGDTITLFTGDEVNPQPNFVSDVVRPAAEVRFGEDRVLRITADAGRFYHPGNEPTRGEFDQHTVVTQFQAPDGQVVDLNTDAHVQFRLYLDDTTRFDRENGHITSDGPVRLVGPAVDFTGTGLDLTFNMRDQRIERLVIAEGDQLRLSQKSSVTRNTPITNNNNHTQGSGTSVPVSPPNESDQPPAQPYRVVLHDDLHIAVGPDNTTLTGDRLEVLFAMKSNTDDETKTSHNSNPSLRFTNLTRGSGNPGGSVAVSATPPLHYVNHPPASTSTSGGTSKADPRALLTPAPDDILVNWTGRLELTPLTPGLNTENLSPQGSGASVPVSGSPSSPDHATLTLHGQPAVIDKPAEKQHITAAAVGYRTADDTVFADGNESHPLKVIAPDLGTLTGTALAINQQTALGHILGPGQLATDDNQLDITFADRLDLTFTPNADGQLDAIDQATFQGNVHAVTTPASTNPDDPEHNADQQLDLTSHTLTLTLTPDAQGNPQPAHLQAAGTPDQPVVAQQPNTTFQAQQLDIDLESSPQGARTSARMTDNPNDPPDEVDRDQSEITITRLRALGHVHVELLEEQTTLTAHALDADPDAGRLELFGENDMSFATLTRQGAALAGVHLILQENAQTADALGPGTFSADVDPDDPTAKLNVTWSTSMAFDNTAGQANFVGDVRAASTSNTDDTSLDAHTLALHFVPQDFNTSAQGSGTSVPVSDKPQASSLKPQASALDLRRAHAHADPDNPDSQVTFTAQTFDTLRGQPDQPLTRMSLWCPELLFVNQPPNLTNRTTIDDNLTIEQVIVPTRGELLLEDYRSPPNEVKPRAAERSDKAPDTTAENSGGPINLVGRGVTAFAWQRKFTLDAQANDLRLEGDVFMLHKPASKEKGSDTSVPVSDHQKSDEGSEQPIQLYAQTLVADLTETGGLGAYLGSDTTAPQARIRKVTADGQVRVAQGPSNVVADHLLYEEEKRTVLLWAEPRRQVTLNRDDQPNGTTTARALRWDLDHDLFTALDPGTGVIPIE